jgi:hypothetical protein
MVQSSDLWNSGGVAGKFQLLDGSAKLIHLGVWAFILVETEKAKNTTNVGNFPTFPGRGIAPDFGIRQGNSKPQN